VIGRSKHRVIGRAGDRVIYKNWVLLSDPPIPRSPDRPMFSHSSDGYILLTLTLMVAVILIALAAVLPAITTQLRRDREIELIHRGAQYARAIKRYYKKAGNYPATIDQLVNTNNIRFLRKRYKDPVAGKDFRLLHFGEVQLSLGAGGLQPVVTGGTQSGVFGTSSLSPTTSSTSPFTPAAQPASSGTPSSGTFGYGAGPLGQSNSASAPNPAGQPNTQSGTGSAAAPQDSSSTSPSTFSSASSSTTPSGSAQSGSQGSSQSSNQSSSPFISVSQMTGNKGPTFGGGPIIGVASTSEKKSFHIFNKKDHYNDWAFVYDPSSDRGALITGPYNGPPKFSTGQVPGAVSPGQTSSGTSSSSSSTQTPFGTPFGQSSSTPSSSGQSSSTQQGMR